MKVEVLRNECSRTYPYVGVGEISGTVVLFTGKGTGVVLYTPVVERRVGKEYTDWHLQEEFRKVESVVITND